MVHIQKWTVAMFLTILDSPASCRVGHTHTVLQRSNLFHRSLPRPRCLQALASAVEVIVPNLKRKALMEKMARADWVPRPLREKIKGPIDAQVVKGSLLCPSCGEQYLHAEGVHVDTRFQAEADVKIRFNCENCTLDGSLVVRQYKGHTLLVWE